MAAQQTKVEEFFGGQVIVRFSSSNHTYSVRIPKGYVEVGDTKIDYPDRKNKFVKVPSVTGFTKAILEKWKLHGWRMDQAVTAALNSYKQTNDLTAARIEGRKKPNEIMKQGGKIGTLVHDWIGDSIEGKDPKTPSEKEANVAILGWKSFLRDHKGIEFVGTECILYHPILDICGTLDVLFKYKGQLGILDVKTSASIYPDFIMQLACYREIVKLMHELPELAWIIQLDKSTGSYKKEDRSGNHKEDLYAFLGAHYIINWVDKLQLTY